MDERAPLVASRSRWGLAKVRCVMSPLAAVALVNTGALCAVGAGYHMLGHQGVSTTTVLAEEAPAGGAHDVGARFDTTGFWQGKASPVAAAAADAVPSVYVAAADGWSTDSDEALRGARVLVTGAAGFIGSHVVQALIDPGAFDSDWPATDPSRVVAVDDFNQYYSSELKRTRAARLEATTGVAVRTMDVCDRGSLDALFAEHGFTHVVHLAGQPGVRFRSVSPGSYSYNNVDCFVALLEAAAAAETMPYVVYASSSSVYGSNAKIPFAEADRVEQPSSLYGAWQSSWIHRDSRESAQMIVLSLLVVRSQGLRAARALPRRSLTRMKSDVAPADVLASLKSPLILDVRDPVEVCLCFSVGGLTVLIGREWQRRPSQLHCRIGERAAQPRRNAPVATRHDARGVSRQARGERRRAPDGRTDHHPLRLRRSRRAPARVTRPPPRVATPVALRRREGRRHPPRPRLRRLQRRFAREHCGRAKERVKPSAAGKNGPRS